MRGVEVGILFIEQARGGVKASFRAATAWTARGWPAQFGGGGHREAAGATVLGPMSEVVEPACSRRCGRRCGRARSTRELASANQESSADRGGGQRRQQPTLRLQSEPPREQKSEWSIRRSPKPIRNILWFPAFH